MQSYPLFWESHAKAKETIIIIVTHACPNIYSYDFLCVFHIVSSGDKFSAYHMTPWYPWSLASHKSPIHCHPSRQSHSWTSLGLHGTFCMMEIVHLCFWLFLHGTFLCIVYFMALSYHQMWFFVCVFGCFLLVSSIYMLHNHLSKLMEIAELVIVAIATPILGGQRKITAAFLRSNVAAGNPQ